MDAKVLHLVREWDEKNRPAWTQTLGNRQEEDSLTRQRSQEGGSLGHLMGRDQCGWNRVNEARGRGRALSCRPGAYGTLCSGLW